jgi:hypothetical protein
VCEKDDCDDWVKDSGVQSLNPKMCMTTQYQGKSVAVKNEGNIHYILG